MGKGKKKHSEEPAADPTTAEDEEELAAMGFSKEPEPAEEEPEEPVMTDPPVKAAATLSESEPVSSAEPPAAPVPAPATPAASDGIIVVDVEPSPRAAKFIGTVEKAGAELRTLESDDVSDGMLHLSKKCTANMKESFVAFKEHALDLGIAVTSEPAPEDGRLKAMYRTSEFKKVAQLPVAMFYAIAALLCLITFAAIYFPKMYTPMLVEKVRGKFIEYEVCMRVGAAADGSTSSTHDCSTRHSTSTHHGTHIPPPLSLSLIHSLSQVDKKAGKAKELVVEYGSKAYEQAKTSQLAAKASEAAAQGLEKASAAYEQVAANPAVQQIAVKGGELASQARAKVAEQLVKARGESPAPALNGTV